jgi:hypothetical protein
MISCVRGQISDALNTTVLPQASGMTSARTPRMIGAFHGAMPRITPAGSRMAMARQPGLSDGITSPPIWVVIAAASRTRPSASMTLNRAHPSVAPISAIIAATKSSARAASASAALLSKARRAFGPVAAQAGSAAAAASATAHASAGVIARAVLAAVPVIGSVRVKVAWLIGKHPLGAAVRAASRTLD